MAAVQISEFQVTVATIRDQCMVKELRVIKGHRKNRGLALK